MPDFAIERRCEGVVCGVDEAGRGPLAGPVVAAAVILDRRRFRGELRRVLDDSKALSREVRESCYEALLHCARGGAVTIGVGAASVGEIDRINILRASLVAMRRAVAALTAAAPPGAVPDLALVDGNVAPSLSCPVRTVVKGDALSFSIAAASVVAKVTRDRIMRGLAQRYPGYGWETNVGYSTAAHFDGIRRLGVTPHHRRSFEPVRLALSGPADLFAVLEAGPPARPGEAGEPAEMAAD
jgi:ribonuclease HII